MNYVHGIYKLSVFNSRPCKFRVKFYTLRIPQEASYPLRQVFYEEEYFKYQIRGQGQSRIEVTVSDGPAAIFLSFTFPRPSLTHHTYSKGFFDSSDEVLELDPFPEFPLSFVYFTSQNSERSLGTEKIRLCVDTESKNSTAYITIQPLTPSGQHLEVSIQEVQISSMIPQNLQAPYSQFSSYFNAVDTSLLSIADRKSHSLEYSLEFTYGEIEFFNYVRLLDTVKLKDNESIWDLGAGAGKSVVAAALMYPCVRVIGVEYLPQLCGFCQSVTKDLGNVTVICGDIRDQDWSSADVIFMSSLCFLDDLMEFIIKKCEGCKKGARALSLREFPKESNWVLTQSVRILMSWGRSICFIYIKS